MVKVILFSGLLFLNASCGVEPSNESSELDLLGFGPSAVKEAVWFLPCDSTDKPPTAQPGQMVITGGNTNAVRENFSGTRLTLQGRVCPPENLPRDTVFLVDISASMGFADADPLLAGACKRLTQLEAMIDAMPANSNFGVVTYDERLGASSSKLYDKKASLFAELTNNGAVKLTDVFCAWSNQSFFDVGMTKAKDLLSRGRATTVQKELVIISDGDSQVSSTNVHLKKGIEIGDELKNKGIVIGTNPAIKVQIAGLVVASKQVDKFIKSLSSFDPAGASLYDDLIRSQGVNSRLLAMSGGKLSSASLSFGPTGAVQKTIELKSRLAADFTYKIDADVFKLDRQQKGYDLKLEYADARGTVKTVTSKIGWVLP